MDPSVYTINMKGSINKDYDRVISIYSVSIRNLEFEQDVKIVFIEGTLYFQCGTYSQRFRGGPW